MRILNFQFFLQSRILLRRTIFKILVLGYLTVILSLFLYSFTQVDLGLTLTKLSIWQVLQKFFQNIGYFQRPLSTGIYLGIISTLFVFYLIFLKTANNFSRKSLFILTGVISFILLFSYNAFSYDLFNYIFDAKIVTYYHQNPYERRALDFPFDPMLSFMHWTHRTLPYGQTWLFLTVPLSFLGMQVFLPTFFLFKALMAASYMGSVFLISKISRKVIPENETFAMIFFALNPLIIIEGLVSAHNDIVMIFLFLLAVYLLISKKYIRSIIMLIISVGIKFSAAFLIPVFGFVYHLEKKGRRIDWEKVFLVSAILMIIPVVLASFRTNFQPWYLLSILPFAALSGKKYYVLIPTLVISFFALLQYVPFLQSGNWDPPIPSILFWLTFSSVFFSLALTFLWLLKVKMLK